MTQMNRRFFIGTGIAALAAPPVLAHTKKSTYVLPPEFMPREVKIQNDFPAGEIHVDPNSFALYWTLPDRRAIRYSVGVGRAGLYHSGEFYVGAKRKWPTWTPTPDMIKRDPKSYARFAKGVPGGIKNPLGARALYLYTPERGDTYLRIHGTNAPQTIGRAVSNGCARLVNDQVAELYDRVPLQTRVVLHPKNGASIQS